MKVVRLRPAGALAEPAADGAANVTGGAHHGHGGLLEIDPEPRGFGFHLLTDDPGGVGVARGEALPLEGCAADLLFLEQVEVFENDRGEDIQTHQ